MGEYVTYRADLWKLGTCEDLYYIRYTDLLAIIADGASTAPGNLTPIEYLGGAFRFRFPFPDEDALGPGRHAAPNYERGLLVPWPEGVAEGADHERVWVTVGIPGEPNGYDTGARLPCPQDLTAEPYPYDRRQPRRLQIVQQRPFEGALWTIVQCPYCRQRWRLPPEEGEALAAFLAPLGGFAVDIAEVAARIRAGYARDVAADIAALRVGLGAAQ